MDRSLSLVRRAAFRLLGLQVGLFAFHVGLGGGERNFVVDRFNLIEWIPHPHRLIVHHVQVDDPSRDFRRQFNDVGLDLTIPGPGRRQVLIPDRETSRTSADQQQGGHEIADAAATSGYHGACDPPDEIIPSGSRLTAILRAHRGCRDRRRFQPGARSTPIDTAAAG